MTLPKLDLHKLLVNLFDAELDNIRPLDANPNVELVVEVDVEVDVELVDDTMKTV